MIDIEFDLCKHIDTGDNGYNGCIETYDKNSFVYFYRWEKNVCLPPFHINFGFISKDGDLDGEVPILNLNEGRKGSQSQSDTYIGEYDPRIIRYGRHDEQEYVLFSTFNKEIHNRFFTIKNKIVYFSKSSTLRLMNFTAQEQEKNWMPFIYKDDLYMVYSIKPHVIVRFYRSGICEKIYESVPSINWEWGNLSGGTQAVKINDEEYLTFFHSFLSPDRANNRVPRQYFIGAYTFEAKPPFRILRMTPEPLVWNALYQTFSESPHIVVFPAGLVNEDGIISMTYGDNDGATYLTKFPVQRILNTMKFL